MRADYCPIANEPCQSLCDTPCGSRKLTDEEVDRYIDAVLQAAGTGLRFYQREETRENLDKMRKAMRRAMNAWRN